MSIHPANVTYVVHDADTPEGMCGWSLVKRVFDRFRIPIPEVAMPLVDALSKSQFGQTITSILDNANAAWADSTEDVSLRKLAYAVRNTFWPVSSVGLHQICATSAGLPGFGGLQITKRGIAVRAWVSALADARKVFMTEDERICRANYATVPRVLFNAAGWPAGVRPADLVDCVQKATKQAPIPTRAFRDSGVHCWTLGFESAPSPTKFTVQINGQLHEILLSPVSPVAPKSKVRNHANKPKPREKSDAKTPAGDIVKVVSNPSSNDSARIDALEKKFDVLEKKQDNFEHKMDRRYDEIADHLRQILQSTNQRPREPTGESPPGKYQKAC
ncbi:unnamed protein product [Durusdinium trenchii]|uniref:Uncharacterized protein n=1 Tax=Durusdinium trenchii TaxID=1381693 RepID=A0ABP0L9A7_9DINO